MCWAVLVLGPRRLPAVRALPAVGVPAVLALVYAAAMLPNLAGTGGGYGSVAEVRRLFASDAVLVGGWVHYLAFDLVVGALTAERMDRAGVHRLVQAGPLAATFLFGPLGFLLGLGAETAARLASHRARSIP